MPATAMNRTDIEAATFRRLLAHLQQRPEISDEVLMASSGFCRSCLAKWYQAASEALATPVSRDEARAAINGDRAGATSAS